MDRFVFLKQTLPIWLTLPYDEIIIVDWTSKEENIIPYVESFKDERIKVIQVIGQKYFNQGAAWNVGIRYAVGEFINGIDCDTTLKPDALQTLDEKKYCTGFQINHSYGTVIFPKKAWALVGGYTEIFKTWSQDDVLFYRDLSQAGYEHIYFPKDQIETIMHDDDVRFKNHEFKFSRSDAITFNIQEELSSDHLKGMKSYDVNVYEWKNGKFYPKNV